MPLDERKLLSGTLRETGAGGTRPSSAPQRDGSRASRVAPRLVPILIAAAAVLLLDALTPAGLTVSILQVLLVWMGTLWLPSRQLMLVAAVCAAFAVLGFHVSPAAGPATWVERSNLLICLGSIWLLTLTCLRQRAAEEARLKARRELAHSQETVRMLSGLLPICAWCRKIRNEEGAWEDLETYIHNHSRAEFTHGMCQECAARLGSELSGSP